MDSDNLRQRKVSERAMTHRARARSSAHRSGSPLGRGGLRRQRPASIVRRCAFIRRAVGTGGHANVPAWLAGCNGYEGGVFCACDSTSRIYLTTSATAT